IGKFRRSRRTMINRAKVLITRSEMQGKELAALLAEKQIESVEFPVLKIDKPTGVLLDSLNEAVIHYNDYDWIVFTSVNGVHAFFERLRSLRLPISEINFAKFAAVGPSTKKAIESYGCHVNIVPDRLYQAEGLIE